MSSRVIPPVAGLNGTGFDKLASAAMEANDAVNDAIRALQECAPHGRDYLTVSEHYAARDRHDAEMRKLYEVRQYIEAWVHAIGEAL